MIKKHHVFSCFLGALVLSIIVIVLPMLGVLLADFFGQRHGCTVHEGFANPCVVGGKDYGETLYHLFVGGWFTFFSVVIGGILLAVWVILLVHYLIRKKPQFICWFWVVCLIVLVGEFFWFGYYSVPLTFYIEFF